MSRVVRVNRNKLYKAKGNLETKDAIQFNNLSNIQKESIAELLYSLFKDREETINVEENCA